MSANLPPSNAQAGSNDLLDEATRLAGGNVGPRAAAAMLALVERVQKAEARAATLSETRTRLLAKHPHTLCVFQREEVEAERDEARGQLDAVRALADEAPAHLLDELRTLLAILDGKTGD